MDDSRTSLSSLLDNPRSYGQNSSEKKDTSQRPKTFAILLEGNRTDILPQELSSEVEMAAVPEDLQQNDQDSSGVNQEKVKGGNEKSSLAKLKQTNFFRTVGSEAKSPYQKESKVAGSGSITSEGENVFQITFGTSTQELTVDYNRKKRGASAQDKNTLSTSFLGTEMGSIITLDIDEKSLSDKIDKQIDDFFANEMPPTQDWTRLKNICKTKFARMKHITSQKVRIFLNKVEKLVHSSEDVATQIMDKKININFAVRSARETAEEIASSETAVVNFVKDVTWAPLTYQKVDIFCNPANSTFITQTFTQTILSMLAMVVGAALYHVIRGIFAPPKDKKEVEPNKIKAIKSLFIWLGTGLSIPGWNALQTVGKNVGLGMNMSAYNAGYFSALFPGIPDGPTQGIASLISANIVNNSWNKFRLKTFFQQLLIFVTFGAIPGAIWQLVYQLITGPIGAYGNLQYWEVTAILGLALAGAVYISNVAYGAAYERFVNKSHFVIELEPVDDFVNLKLDFLLEDYDNIVSYNGRAGAPSRTSIVILRHEHAHSL